MGVIGSGPVQNRVATGFVRGSSLHVFEPRRVALEIPTSKQLTRSSGARSGFFQRFLDILYATRCVASEIAGGGDEGFTLLAVLSRPHRPSQHTLWLANLRCIPGCVRMCVLIRISSRARTTEYGAYRPLKSKMRAYRYQWRSSRRA